ncbi:hypothetical protein QNH46_03040 [Paenibacillus woosongensis]|uniref:Uncharacterized protein n=1 Tax=Paenibacillus woosongensis TaxID=307580 RepID=A0AA95L2H1_9BACL|nr:hypothetical protein [Paenibacillus woosongensis]WHX49677.1 hypothetical protein QNH46_03040 [Paenibacillus woosongensis]
MKLGGIIEKIIIDGYERLIYLNVITRQKKLWCHLIQHNEYLEKGGQSQFLHVNQNITLNIGIDLVNDYSVITKQPELIKGVLQPISESSHIIAVATVMEKEDDYTLICDIQDLGSNVLVEFEEKISIEIGASLRLKGNLKAELDE